MASRTSTQGKDSNADAATGSPDGEKLGPNATKEVKKGFLSKLKGFWTGLGLDFPTLVTMAKGGLPPVISLAMCEFPLTSRPYPEVLNPN